MSPKQIRRRRTWWIFILLFEALVTGCSHLKSRGPFLTKIRLAMIPRLGPMEVAILLQSGLAAVPQGRQVQQNQRMLLEMMVSQPPLFLKGVLYELSNNGSSRVSWVEMGNFQVRYFVA